MCVHVCVHGAWMCASARVRVCAHDCVAECEPMSVHVCAHGLWMCASARVRACVCMGMHMMCMRMRACVADREPWVTVWLAGGLIGFAFEGGGHKGGAAVRRGALQAAERGAAGAGPGHRAGQRADLVRDGALPAAAARGGPSTVPGMPTPPAQTICATQGWMVVSNAHTLNFLGDIFPATGPCSSLDLSVHEIYRISVLADLWEGSKMAVLLSRVHFAGQD